MQLAWNHAAQRSRLRVRCGPTFRITTACVLSLSAAGHAASTTMAVNYAFDGGNSKEYLDGSPQVNALNTTTEEGGKGTVKASSWWEASYTDPYPSPIQDGATLSSVMVTVQYAMGGAWTGVLRLEAHSTSGLLGWDDTWPVHLTAFAETWDITSPVNGEADPLAALNDLRIRVWNMGSPGVTWSYTFVDVTYSANVPPDQPSIASPAPDATGVSRNPTVTSSVFSDPNGDPHASSDWEVYEDASLTSRVASSIGDATNLTSIAVNNVNVTFEGTLSGKTCLAPLSAGGDYWVRVLHTDDKGESSPWSAAVHFTTATNQAPAQPSITSPTADATGVSRNPTITASAFSDADGDAHASSDWEVFDNVSLAPGALVAYSLDDSSNLMSVAVSDANFTFGNSLVGQTSLAASMEYWVRVTCRDEYGAASTSSAALHFTTGTNEAPDSPSIISPTADETGVSRNPTVTSSPYNDPEGDGHASNDWEVFQDAGLASRVASSMNDATNLDSITVTPANVTFEGSLLGKSALAALTDYWVRVTYRDTQGSASVSAAVHFTTAANQAPTQPSITSPTADATGVSRNPTITSSAYNDPEGDGHAASDWEVFDNVSLAPGARVAYSLGDTTNLTSVPVNAVNVVFEGALSGKPSLAPLTHYWARVRYRDVGGAEATWSSPRHFTTAASQPPAAPSITAPAADQIDVSRNVTVLASAYSDPDNDAHGSSDWQVFEDASLLSRVASSLNDASSLGSIAADAMTFEGALAGRSNLDPLTEYWAVVTYRDEYGATSANSAPLHFTTGANQEPAQAWIASPAADEAGVALSPTIELGPYADPDGDPHLSTDWEIYEDDGLADRVASSPGDTVNLTSVVADAASMSFEGKLAGGDSLEQGKEYWARARFTDGLGLAGEWAQLRRFKTGVFTIEDEQMFFGGGCRPQARGRGDTAGSAALATMLLAACLCVRLLRRPS